MFRRCGTRYVVRKTVSPSITNFDQSHVVPHDLNFCRRLSSAIRLLRFAAAALLVLSIVSSAWAQTTNWVLPPGQLDDWSNPSNWDSGVPTSNTNVYIANGGTATISLPGAVCEYLTVGNSSGSGTVQMTDGSLSERMSITIGYSGTGAFIQSGGTHSVCSGVGTISLMPGTGKSATYELRGTGCLLAGSMAVAASGTTTFTQSGGTSVFSSDVNVGSKSGSATFNLSDGSLSAAQERVCSGTGTFIHSGGTNTVSKNALYLGCYAGDNVKYMLSGTGQLQAPSEFVGDSSNIFAGTSSISVTALLQQSGGSNATNLLSIGSGGRYEYSGGDLHIASGFTNQGVFDGGGSTFSLGLTNALVDFSNGAFQNVGGMTLNVGANSLLIVPAGFNTAMFAGFNCSGLVHTAGSTLTLSDGQAFSGAGAINDPVSCQGTITAAPGCFININNGLTISGNGVLALGNNSYVTTNDIGSNMSGGSLSTWAHDVGVNGTGQFSQSGGTNAITAYLRLGLNSGDAGTYVLSGTGCLVCPSDEIIGDFGAGTVSQSGGSNTTGTLLIGYISGGRGTYSLSDGLLSASMEYLGSSGIGVFDQSGGTNSLVSGTLQIGNSSAASGTYTLRGGSLVVASEIVGTTGSGTFTQSGGTNTVTGGTGSFCIAQQSGSKGVYNLNGGTLIVPAITVGSGTGTFNWGGGTLQPSAPFSNAMTIMLTGNGGDASFDTAGLAGTLSGASGERAV